ncbi:MAG TPA: PAS domain-containing protein, partial [Vicinamibacterales bacterium]|nr:PAS domain-containing protein [Vicinamibacterales bacterium]
ILEDFRLKRHDRAAFWITMKGRFIHIEYFALRGQDGAYLGCLEVSQDLTDKRALEGEQRLLSYADRGDGDGS